MTNMNMSSKRIKVLQVNKLYAPFIGGVERTVQDIAEGLKDKVDMKVLACQPKGSTTVEVINGVEVTKAGSLGIYWSMPVSLSFPFLLAKMSRDADIIHFHFPFPLGDFSYLLLGARGKKIVVTYHCDIVRQKKALILYKPFLFKFLSIADRILVTSPNILQSSKYLTPFKDKCVVVPLSIPIEEYTRIDQTFDVGISQGEKIVLFVGRLSYYKGVEYLIEAMQWIDAKLLIIGDGELRNVLEEKTFSLGLNKKVNFLGKVPDQLLRYCYQICDVFVLPSIELSEAFGIVQMEAMAYGKPVVNTNLPTGVPFVSVHGETGLTVPPRDSIALANAVNKILEDEKLAKTFSQNAIRRVNEKFSRKRMLEQIYSIYNELMSS